MFLIDIEKVNAHVGADEALLNTLIGMGTVFIVLILISIIIFLLKFVPKMFERKAAASISQPEKKAEDRAPAPAPAPEQEPVVNNDTQIAAVIMAAIAARMETETGVPVSPEGLVIRSIKKRTFN